MGGDYFREPCGKPLGHAPVKALAEGQRVHCPVCGRNAELAKALFPEHVLLWWACWYCRLGTMPERLDFPEFGEVLERLERSERAELERLRSRSKVKVAEGPLLRHLAIRPSEDLPSHA